MPLPIPTETTLANALEFITNVARATPGFPSRMAIEVADQALAKVSKPVTPHDCEDCDGNGRIWNNADPTSGQWVSCDCGEAA